MSSILQELQLEAASSEVPVSELLRKAKIVAVKLDLHDFSIWIEKELNGYDTSDEENYPRYREVRGEPKAWNPYHGWQPIIFTGEGMAEMMSRRDVHQPIGELDDLLKNSDGGIFAVQYSAEAKMDIMKAIQLETDIQFVIGRSAIAGILDAVRNLILDWALKLEKAGVKGEGVSFSKEDLEKAKVAGNTYTIGYIENFAGSIGNLSDNASVTVQQANGFSSENILELVSKIEKYLKGADLSLTEEREVQKITAELSTEIKKTNPEPSKVKKALASLKIIFEGAAGNIIAQGILSELAKIVK
jgi:hypothetical protein